MANDEEPNFAALKAEWEELDLDAKRGAELARKRKDGKTLSNDEENWFRTVLPAKLARAVDVTRILRRTNTGPAKAKIPKVTKKALEQKDIDNMLDGII